MQHRQATQTENIISELLGDLGIHEFSTNPQDWGNPLLLEFGNTNAKGTIKEKHQNARDKIYGYVRTKYGAGKKGDKVKGLYAVYNQDNQCLYLGKSKHLYSRVYRHYQTSIDEEKPKRKGYERYLSFFRDEHCGMMKVYLTKIQFEREDDLITHTMSEEEKAAILLHKYKGETLRIATERLIASDMLAKTGWKQPVFESKYPSTK